MTVFFNSPRLGCLSLVGLFMGVWERRVAANISYNLVLGYCNTTYDLLIASSAGFTPKAKVLLD